MDFRTLYIKISPALKQIAAGYKDRITYIDQDDLYQEMSLHLWNNFKTGLPEKLNESYVITGCKFHILNYLRKKMEKVTRFGLDQPLNQEGNTLKDIIARQVEPIPRCLDRKLVFEEIINNGYTKREKEVLILLLQGLTAREAGGRLGISHVMVLKYKQRIIKKWQRSKGYQREQNFT